MIIKPSTKRIADTMVTFSAPIEWEKASLPENQWYPAADSLWWQFPDRYAAALSDRGDPFLVELLPLAMFFNEDVHVEMPVSRELLYNLREFQRVLTFWHPEWFSSVRITCSAYADTPTSPPAPGALCMYSGGVDSTYTLHQHLSENEQNPDYQISHALFLRGFDRYEQDETADIKTRSFQELADEIGIEFISAYTNARDIHRFINKMTVQMTFGSILAGTALCFDRMVGRFLFSTDTTYEYPIIATVNHHTIPLFSNGRMECVISDGTAPRPEKVRAIANWPPAHDRLITCYREHYGFENCGTCTKCAMTISALDIEQVLERFRTFPDHVDRAMIRGGWYTPEHLTYVTWWIQHARSRGRRDIAFDYTYVLWRNRLLHVLEDHVLRHARPVWRYVCDPWSFACAVSAVFRRYCPGYSPTLDKAKQVYRRYMRDRAAPDVS